MKKKGFTLAELLGVIVIISLLLLIIIPTIINGVKNEEKEVAQTQSNIIFEATREYLDLDKNTYPNIPGNVYCITLKQLIEAGKLVDPVKKIVEDGDYDIDNYTIEVRISNNGVRKYTAKTKAECQNQTSKNIEMVVSPSNNKWSTKKTVTIYYPNLGEGHTMEYKIDDGPWQQVDDSEIILTFDKNSKVEARMTGKTEINKKITVEKIDKLPPVILSKSLSSWNDDYKQQVNITATDAHSGVGGYCIKQNTTKPEADDSCFKAVRFPAYGGIGTISEFLSQGTYYIFIKDRVGNVSGYDESMPDAANNEVNRNLIFTVKDDVPPTCRITTAGTMGNNSWYKGEVTIGLITDDNESGVRNYDLTTSPSPSYRNVNQLFLRNDTKGINYYGYVEDKAGNKNTCSSSAKKDTVKPSIGSVYNSENDVWTNQNVTVSASTSDATSGMSSVSYSYSSNGAYSQTNWDYGSTLTSPMKTFTSDMNQNIYFVATDNAGHSSIAHGGVVKIDKTPPYMNLNLVWESLAGSETYNNCYNSNNAGGDKTCYVNISLPSYDDRWGFDTVCSGVDYGSGIAKKQYKWTHNGSSAQHPSWTDAAIADSQWDWTAKACASCAKPTWLELSTRFIDNAGNAGYSYVVHFNITYY